ncbi:hypothetical protein AX14_002256 [Amanita brunnescens Koide BX004]|nr:hypothetical protein AX14_002256 [Amanita brunnescens Koide BX004]
MTIDQFQEDLRLVAGNASDLVSCLAAVGNTISVTETAGILSRIPPIRYNLDKCEQDTKDILNVSDSDAESILDLIKGIVPDINKGIELIIQKKDVFAQLHNVFSIEGLFSVPDIVGYTIIRLISAQVEGLHGRILTLGDILIQLSPPKYKEEATNIKSQLDAQFQQTLEVYSS